jgi:hypothetical protein
MKWYALANTLPLARTKDVDFNVLEFTDKFTKISPGISTLKTSEGSLPINSNSTINESVSITPAQDPKI